MTIDHKITYVSYPKVVPGVRVSWNGTENKVDGTRRGSSEPDAGVVVDQHVQVGPKNIAGDIGGGELKGLDDGKRCVQPVNAVGVLILTKNLHILKVAKSFDIPFTVSLTPLQGCYGVIRD